MYNGYCKKMIKKKPKKKPHQRGTAFKGLATTYFPIRRLADSIIGAGRLIRRLADRNGKRWTLPL
jgi:hypothetical protein